LGNEQSLLEGVLSGENRVADAIGEGHPRRVGRKCVAVLRGGLLEADVFFHGVVAAMHEFVIGRAMSAGEMQDAGSDTEAAVEGVTEGGEHTGHAGEMRTEGFESLGSEPNAILGRVYVGEETENAGTVGGAGGKRIKMQEVVARVDTSRPAFFFHRTKTGEIEFPFGGVGEKKAREELDRALRIIAENAAKFSGFGLFGGVKTSDTVFGWAIGNVLVISGTGLLAAEEEIAIAAR
jgi:hypothetical protein